VAQTGDYSAKPAPGQLLTVLQGVKSHVSPETKVLYAQGCEILSTDTAKIAQAVEVAKQADVIILVVGDNCHPAGGKSTTGENNDGATLEIPGAQRQLIKEVQAVGKPVVLVLVNGKPFTLAWEAENIPAILETWYPGEDGGNATADLLFGDRNPSGRLPITFPRHVGQLPLHYNYLPSGRGYEYYDMPFTPLFRFGHGLSYTSFKYSNLVATPKKDDPGFVSVFVDVENTGERDGDEVAQLYVTDMLTSVITPVIELKGIKRVSLKKGEKKTVSFDLTPYRLSLLDSSMTRVLEPGKFRMHAGCVCPEPPKGGAEHKQKIGFTKPEQGISGEFEVPRKYKADFVATVEAPESVRGGDAFQAKVTVKNQGNLLDVVEIKLCGETVLDTRRFEIEPGETRTHAFNVSLYKSGKQHLTAIVAGKLIYHAIQVSAVPAKLDLSNVRTAIDDDGALKYEALARNLGSATFKGNVGISVDGREVAGELLELEPGATRNLALGYVFPHAGMFRVKVGNAAEMQMNVNGGVGLALRDPLFYLNFHAADASGVKNEVTGTMLPFVGKPQFVDGKFGKAFRTADKKTYVKVGNADLYRKSFTLAAWVHIESLENKQAVFFGGEAPMGANVDVKGTGLAAAVFNEKMMLTFRDITTQGNARPPIGKWTHLAFTYDADQRKGSLYLDGNLETTKPQEPYTGPLEMIGSAPELLHGVFAMDEVLVTLGAMGPKAVKELARKGVETMRKGELTTDWHPFTGAVNALQSFADIPAGSSIKVTVDCGDKAGKVLDSKTVELKPGEQNLSLNGLPSGTQIRLRIEIASQQWNASPVLQAVVLSGPGATTRWSTVNDWRKCAATGSVKIGL